MSISNFSSVSIYFVNEIVMTSIRLIYNVKIVGEENLKKNDFPAIFGFNHGEEIGRQGERARHS